MEGTCVHNVNSIFSLMQVLVEPTQHVSMQMLITNIIIFKVKNKNSSRTYNNTHSNNKVGGLLRTAQPPFLSPSSINIQCMQHQHEPASTAPFHSSYPTPYILPKAAFAQFS